MIHQFSWLREPYYAVNTKLSLCTVHTVSKVTGFTTIGQEKKEEYLKIVGQGLCGVYAGTGHDVFTVLKA